MSDSAIPSIPTEIWSNIAYFFEQKNDLISLVKALNEEGKHLRSDYFIIVKKQIEDRKSFRQNLAIIIYQSTEIKIEKINSDRDNLFKISCQWYDWNIDSDGDDNELPSSWQTELEEDFDCDQEELIDFLDVYSRTLMDRYTDTKLSLPIKQSDSLRNLIFRLFIDNVFHCQPTELPEILFNCIQTI